MNTWNPAGWQLIQHRVQILTERQPSFDAIEQFIDTHDLWESSPESIASHMVAAFHGEAE